MKQFALCMLLWITDLYFWSQNNIFCRYCYFFIFFLYTYSIKCYGSFSETLNLFHVKFPNFLHQAGKASILHILVKNYPFLRTSQNLKLFLYIFLNIIDHLVLVYLHVLQKIVCFTQIYRDNICDFVISAIKAGTI